ncbi:hypothetical protein Q5H93_21505 [Hymenobacter sp. ASUV-10]|uniref:Lipocalin-like domain-containing protein n=1 Tax=Hymenobacter aranciens TaxID=3063996 RepID=A0ABT9BGG0_9BACT|nr:hypothetical protein [Hymenobacter sp. ASUV-10]MDO7877336.1 hypothetical protein [Hymenobacter sp. ASUV-10]
MKTLLPALLLTTLLASCAKDDAPSLLGEWRPLSAYAVHEGPQAMPSDTIRLPFDTRLRVKLPVETASPSLTGYHVITATR